MRLLPRRRRLAVQNVVVKAPSLRNHVFLVKILGSLVITFIFAGFGYYIWSATEQRRDLANATAEYRQAGLPWTAELIFPVGHHFTGGPNLAKSLAMLEESNVSDPYQLVQQGEYAAARPVMTKFASVMSSISTAAKRPDADFQRDWAVDCFGGTVVAIPEYRESKQAAMLFASRAVLRANSHDVAGSDQDLEACWNLSDRIGEEPSLIAILVQTALRSIAMRAVESCAELYVTARSANAGPIASLQATVRRMSSHVDLALAVRGEAFFSLDGLRNMARLKPILTKQARTELLGRSAPIDPKIIVRDGEPHGPDARKNGPIILRMFVAATRIVRSDGPDLLKLKTDFTRLSQSLTVKGGPAAKAAKAEVDVLAEMVDSMTRDEAKVRTMQAYIASAVFRAQKGRWPRDLDETPGKWIDPYDGDQLRISVHGDSFRVYSVGPTMVDADGKSQFETHGRGPYNIASGYPEVN